MKGLGVFQARSRVTVNKTLQTILTIISRQTRWFTTQAAMA